MSTTQTQAKPRDCEGADCSRCDFHGCMCHPHHAILEGAMHDLPCTVVPAWLGECPGVGDRPRGTLHGVEGGGHFRDDGAGWLDLVVDGTRIQVGLFGPPTLLIAHHGSANDFRGILGA